MNAKLAEPAINRPVLEPLLGVDDWAAALAVNRRTIERMRAAGKLPRPDLRVGSLPRWKAETIRAWINGQAENN